MAKSKPAQADILDELDALPPPVHWRHWFSRCSPDVQETLLEVRKRWQAGKYHISKKQLHEFLATKLSIGVGVCPFRAWLNESDD